MKPEDVVQLVAKALQRTPYPNNLWRDLSPEWQLFLEEFATTIESHVRAETVAMCKEKARITTVYPLGEDVTGLMVIDWSAVDAELSGHVMPGMGDAPQCPRCGATMFDVPCVDAAVKEGGGGG